MKNYRQKIGKIGQKIAKNYLIKRGYTIIDENVYFRCGEIDIIAKKNDSLFFVEVKTRVNNKFGYPEDSVSVQKLTKIENSILSYIDQKGLKNAYFMFVISIFIDLKNNLIKIRSFDI